MATTTNYGWDTPDDTDLVKDGAAAIRTLGSSVDTTTKALNPSTTLGDIEYRSSTADTNTRLGIGTDGQVLTVTGGVPAWGTSSAPGFVGASVFTSSNQSISNNTLTTITFNSENFDTNAFHDNSTNNSRITIPSGYDGKYLITSRTGWQSSTGQRQTVIRKNGSTNVADSSITAANGNYTANSCSQIVSAVAGDYFEIQGWQNSGVALLVVGSADYTDFSIAYLGA